MTAIPLKAIPLEPIPVETVPVQTVAPRSARAAEAAHIPLSRIVSVELRKSFDTRSGFWLLASIGIASLLATAGVVIWA